MNENEERNAPNAKSNATILIVALLAFGFLFGGFGAYRYKIGRESANWPSAKGKITYSRAHSHKKKTGHEYMPTVRYAYAVNGASYTGTRITASDHYQKTLSGAEDVLRKYPAGTVVSVYYDPSDPTSSLLETGLKKNVYALLGGGGACFLFAVLIAVSAIRKRAAA